MESISQSIDQLSLHSPEIRSSDSDSEDDIIPLGSLFNISDPVMPSNNQTRKLISSNEKQLQSKKKIAHIKQNDSSKGKPSTNNKNLIAISSEKFQKSTSSKKQQLSKICQVPRNFGKKRHFQKNQLCLKVIGIVEWVEDSKKDFKVKVEEGPYAHRQLKCSCGELSDSLVPVIANKTKLELGIKVISQPKEYLKIVWANVLAYTRLTTSDVCKAFKNLPEDISHEEVIEKLYISWRPFLMALLHYANELDDDTLNLVLLKILPPSQEPLLKVDKYHQIRFQEVLEQLSSPNSKFLARLGQNNTCDKELVKHLIKSITCVTKSFDSVLHLLNKYYLDDAENLIYLIKSCKRTDPWASQSLTAQCFRNMPLVPVAEELMGVITKLTREASVDTRTRALLELESHLVPNRIEGPWNSSEEFLDVHFRLLREECFASIRDQIASIRLGSYNYRRVYRDVKVVGYAISNGTIVVRIQYRTHSFRTNLMFGNLLCIDTDMDFSNPIWATVHSSEMRGTQLEISLVGVGDVYLENYSVGLPSAELFVSAIQRLISCQSGMMVESSTYYHAFKPILLRLQNLNESEFPFSSEILLKSLEPQPSILLKEKNFTETDQFQTLSSHKNTKLDDSQKAAVEAALQNRFSLIQGPPGCGKTFVGKEIVKAMLQSKNFQGPILIMSYKNNALDSLLEGCLEFTKSLVRIGGKSTSEKIGMYNLHNLFDEARKYFPQDRFNHLQEAYSQLEHFKDELRDAMKELSGGFTAEALFYLLQREGTVGWQQLHSLLLENFAENYGRYIGQELKYPSLNEEKQAVTDILQNPETAINLLQYALRSWLPGSQLKKLLPKSQKTLFCSNADSSKKSNDESADEEFEEDGWEEVFAERCVGSSKTIEFEKMVQKRNKLYRELQNCMAYLEPDYQERKVRGFPHVWRLSTEGRYLLLSYWLRQWWKEKNEHLAKTWDQYRRFYQQIENLEEERNVEFLKSRDLVACTITGCCLKMGIISRVAPSVIIVEEAAEILESQLIAALPSSVQHLVLIGDHRQLPPQVHHHRLARHFNLNVSIFERLAKNGYPVSQLRYHRRGPEYLCPLFSGFYDQEIIPMEVNFKLPEVLKDLGFMFWWTHNSPARSPNGTSFENEFEAAMLVGAVRLLIELGDIDVSKISIITAYLGQAKKIKELLAKDMIESVNVCTIDRFQGDENDYVFLSLTRSASEEFENNKPSIGFLGSPNRACVALSRARRGLYVFGCSSLFETRDTWNRAVEYFRSQNKLGREIKFYISGKLLTFDHPDDFAKLFKKLALESQEMKIEMHNQLAKELPTKAREGIHNVTKAFGRKIERLMNKSVLDRRDLGRGGDANGIKFSGFKVLKVKQIFYKEMYLLYLHHLKKIEKNNPPPLGFEIDSNADWMSKMMVNTSKVNEAFLFHGTRSADIANIIATTGFDERVASPSGMFGAGIYFAENADKSDQYTQGPTHVMFLTRVILGNPFKTTKPTNGLRRPPPIDEKKPTKLYDSVIAVSGRKGALAAANHRHQEFIVYDRYQCLPVFIIEYTHTN